MQNSQDVQLASAALAGSLPKLFSKHREKTVGLVLGTGLSSLAETLANPCIIPFSQLPSFPESSVESHRGVFIHGELNGQPVLVQAGRCHLYEGYTPAQICMGVRVMAQLGIRKLVLTNAAGSLNPLFPAGALMCLSDMINFTGVSPLTGPNHDTWGSRFPDFSRVFDPDMRKIAINVALQLGIKLFEGVYIGVHGPELETPAETRMYRFFGADAIGMSTILEAAAARHMNMKILGISCLTNQNLPDCMTGTSLDDIIRTAAQCGEKLEKLLFKLLPLL